MSVLVPDHKVFSYVHSGLRIAGTRTTADAKHSYIMSSHFQSNDPDKESERLVKSWLRMCEQSFNQAYNETGTTTLKLRELPFNPTQLLKYIECIEYNIEKPGIQTPQQHLDYDLLKRWEKDLMAAIIHETEEYKQSKWSEI